MVSFIASSCFVATAAWVEGEGGGNCLLSAIVSNPGLRNPYKFKDKCLSWDRPPCSGRGGRLWVDCFGGLEKLRTSWKYLSLSSVIQRAENLWI